MKGQITPIVLMLIAMLFCVGAINGAIYAEQKDYANYSNTTAFYNGFANQQTINLSNKYGNETLLQRGLANLTSGITQISLESAKAGTDFGYSTHLPPALFTVLSLIAVIVFGFSSFGGILLIPAFILFCFNELKKIIGGSKNV